VLGTRIHSLQRRIRDWVQMCLGASLPKALRDHDAAIHDIGAEATLFGVMVANR